MTAEELRSALRRLGLSQAEAARRLGVDPQTVWRWLHNQRRIPGPVEAAVRAWEELYSQPSP